MAKKVAKKGNATSKTTAKSAVKRSTTKKVASRETLAPKTSGSGKGIKEAPWTLKTPSGQSEYLAYRDSTLDPPALVVIVGKTELRYALQCIEDLHTMLKQRGDWMLLGTEEPLKWSGNCEAHFC